MSKAAGEVLLVLLGLVAVSTLPYILYWLLWLFTVWDLPPQAEQGQDKRSAIRAAEEAWALKTVAISALGIGIYRMIMLFAVR